MYLDVTQDMHPVMVKRSGFCDLQPVFGSTAQDTYALLHKQLVSIGCPVPKFAEPEPNEGDRCKERFALSPSNPNVLRTYIYCSDGGPDQAKYKRLLGAVVYHDPNVFLLNIGCILHAQQLVVKDAFAYLDNWTKVCGKRWRYFPSLAKAVYIWRDNAPTCLNIWIRFFGERSAAKCAFRLPPKPIAGRWGSIFLSHQDLKEFLGCQGSTKGSRESTP